MSIRRFFHRQRWDAERAAELSALAFNTIRINGYDVISPGYKVRDAGRN